MSYCFDPLLLFAVTVAAAVAVVSVSVVIVSDAVFVDA